MATSTFAAAAYQAGQSLGSGTAASFVKPNISGAGAEGFAQLLQGAMGNAADKGRAAEQASFAAATGKNDLVDVVTAVTESEAALETLVAVRDRVIAAYEEIMRMPI
jgi:flagellar hook-basal body complex protein FliE